MLARVRGEFPARSAGDAGMGPLTSRETAKGRKSTTQLAALRQVSSCFQRSHPRAKRKPDPRIKALQPGSSPLGCGRDCARAGRIAERCGRCMLAWGASLRSGRNKIGGTLVRGCGKIYDSHLTCMEKPCIMIDKEILLLKSYLLELLINNRYTHKEKKQWQKLEL